MKKLANIIAAPFIIALALNGGHRPVRRWLTRQSLLRRRLLMPQNIRPAVVEFFSFYCPPCFAFSQQYGIDKGIWDVLPSGQKMVKYHVDFLGLLGPQLTDA